MIYLIGGPPKCGKTTLAKNLAEKLQIPWVASDTLEVVAMNYAHKYAPKKFAQLYPHSTTKGKNNDETYALNSPKQVAKNYTKQAKATYAAIEMFSLCEITDGNDYIIEGYHVTPELAARLIKKQGRKNFRILFLVKSNVEKLIHDFKKSSTPNDWILKKTKKAVTLKKIAEMVSHYGTIISKEAKKYKFPVKNMDENFEATLRAAYTSLRDL